MKYYFRAFKNYAVSEGRASRRELIWFFVFHYLAIMILSFMDGYFGLYSTEIPLDYGYLTIAYIVASACPAICLQVRRLHDVNKSGSWWYASKVPLLCLYVYYLYLKRGVDYINGYGAPINYGSSSTEHTETLVSTFEEVRANIPSHVLTHCENIRGDSNSLLDFLKQVARDRHIPHAYITPLLVEFSQSNGATQSVPTIAELQEDLLKTGVAPLEKPCFCRSCGEKLIEGSRFCRRCGTEVVEVE